MNTDIADSVGDQKKGARNSQGDVKTVQGLLNIQLVVDRRSDPFLRCDGRMGTRTLGAITEFQRRRGLDRTGIIQPRDRTMEALLRFSGPSSMRVSQNAIRTLEDMEQFSATPYDDPARPIPNATIGFGHRLHSGPVTERDRQNWGLNGISRARAESMLRQDLRTAEDEVNRDVRVPLSQNQFDGLVSLTSNIGPDAFRRSTLLRVLNEGDYDGAANQIPAFGRAGRAHPQGLRNRRREEERLFRER